MTHDEDMDNAQRWVDTNGDPLGSYAGQEGKLTDALRAVAANLLYWADHLDRAVYAGACPTCFRKKPNGAVSQESK